MYAIANQSGLFLIPRQANLQCAVMISRTAVKRYPFTSRRGKTPTTHNAQWRLRRLRIALLTECLRAGIFSRFLSSVRTLLPT